MYFISSERFGLYEVDYDDPERTCTPRKSAFVYKQIAQSHVLDMNYEPPDRPRFWKFKPKTTEKMFDFILNSRPTLSDFNYEQIDNIENTTNCNSDSDQTEQLENTTTSDSNSEQIEKNSNSYVPSFNRDPEPTEDSAIPDFNFETFNNHFDFNPPVSESPQQTNFYFDPTALTRTLALKTRLGSRKRKIWNASSDLSRSMKRMTNVTNRIMRTVIGL